MGIRRFGNPLVASFSKWILTRPIKLPPKLIINLLRTLMPKYPIYKELLSEEAQAVIGETHPDGGGAKRLLRGGRLSV